MGIGINIFIARFFTDMHSLFKALNFQIHCLNVVIDRFLNTTNLSVSKTEEEMKVPIIDIFDIDTIKAVKQCLTISSKVNKEEKR